VQFGIGLGLSLRTLASYFANFAVLLAGLPQRPQSAAKQTYHHWNFVRFAMPADFLDALTEHITDFQSALRGNQVMATAAIDDTLEEGLGAVQQLDAIVRNTFHGDAARLAAWTSARHVERSARKPQTPSPSPGSTPTPPAR